MDEAPEEVLIDDEPVAAAAAPPLSDQNKLLAQLRLERERRLRQQSGADASAPPLATATTRPAAAPVVGSGRLKVLTYNVWFGEEDPSPRAPPTEAGRVRFTAILAILAEEQPDVICLQEMVAPFVRLLGEARWVGQYRVSPPDLTAPYFTLLLVKKELAAVSEGQGGFQDAPFANSLMVRGLRAYDMHLSMSVHLFCPHAHDRLPLFHRANLLPCPPQGRSLLSTRVRLPPSPAAPALPGLVLTVGTAHLESPCVDPRTGKFSLFSQPRQEQLRSALQSLTAAAGASGAAVLAGDMNWNDREGDGPVAQAFPRGTPAPWADVWAALRPADPGYTYDKQLNPSVRIRKNLRVRMDRILVMGGPGVEDRGPALRARSARMVGTKEVRPGLCPSDHFGVVAEFEY